MSIDYYAVIAAESTRLVTAVEANRGGKIPWSDRWTVATVAKHVGGVHHVVSQVVRDRPTADFGVFASLDVPQSSDPALGAWIGAGTASMLTEMRSAGPDAACWSWHPDRHDVGFWIRRMAHETLVHRWDAEVGAGVTIKAMDPAVAADGLDEFLDVFVALTRDTQKAPAGPSIHIECSDSGDSWYLQLPEAGQRVLSREQVDCTVDLRGPAEGLLLFAWGRRDPLEAGLEVHGDVTMEVWKRLIPPI